MPCNGWNHLTACDCGWGGMWHGNVPQGGAFACTAAWADSQPNLPLATSIDRLIKSRTVRSLTIPNAHCPVCGATVFFYQNEFGSRVFFNSLGPPWPKHPCTDNDRYRYSTSARILAPVSDVPKRRPNESDKIWRVVAIWRKRDRSVILYDFEKDEYLRLEIGQEKFGDAFPVVSIKQISKEFLTLSYFHMGICRSLTIHEVKFEKVRPLSTLSLVA